MSPNEEVGQEPVTPTKARTRMTPEERASRRKARREGKHPGVSNAGGQDTTQRAYFGIDYNAGYPLNKRQPGLRYVKVVKLPEDYDCDMYQHYEGLGYTFVEKIGTDDRARWYSLPQATYDARKELEREHREAMRNRARQMPKLGGDTQVWVAKDEYAKLGAGIAREPIVFNH